MILSVLLSVSHVLGRSIAVEVTISFLEKAAKAKKSPLVLDRVRLENILDTLIKDVEACGPSWVRDKATVYDSKVSEGEAIWGSQTFQRVTIGMMASLIWWLYQGIMKSDSDGQDGASDLQNIRHPVTQGGVLARTVRMACSCYSK